MQPNTALMGNIQGEDFYDEDDDGYVGGPVVAEYSEDDGYVSPEFDLPSASDDESRSARPPMKKPRTTEAPAESTLEAEEELALKMLRSRR